jgi:hypothetical protein
MPPLAAFVPDGPQLVQAAALVAVAFGLNMIGAAARRLTGGGDALPAADLMVGWVAVTALFTLLGSLTTLPFTARAWGVAALATVATGWCVRRRAPLLPEGGGRLLVLLLPLFLVTLSKVPSENDEFSQWLPNLRYLLLVDHFPGAGLPVSDSTFPAYPYTLNFVAYLASRLSGTLADTAVPRFNMLLLGSLALLLLDIFRRGHPTGAAAGWRGVALALLAVTLFSPTFVPNLVLSNYADGATAVSVAFFAVLLLRLVEAERPGAGLRLQVAAAAAALLMTKQANLVLLVLVLGAVAVTHLRRPMALVPVAVSLVPAVLLYLAWRHQVASIAGGEMPIPAFSDWQWHQLAETLGSMATVVGNKGGYFGLATVLCGVALHGMVKGRQAGGRLPLVFAAAFSGFTVFLLWVYLAVYTGYEGRSAASFWRYHTQLGGLQLAAAAALLPALLRRLPADRFGRASAAFGALCLVLAASGPILAWRFVRFDLHPMKAYGRAVMADARAILPADARIAVLDATGSGFMDNFVKWHLGFGRHLVFGISAFNAGGACPKLAATGAAATHLWALSWTAECLDGLGMQLSPGASHLLARRPEGGWVEMRSWPFSGFSDPARLRY